MADLSLEDIATQLEEALGTTTGTTIAAGTIAPVGITTSAGKKKLSWPEIVKKIREGIGLGQSELLPDLPAGVSSTSFFRAGAESGFLPSGASTFRQAPFTGGFANRLAVAQGLVPEEAQPATEQAVATTQPAPQQRVASVQDFNFETTGDIQELQREQSLMELDPVIPSRPMSTLELLGGGIFGNIGRIAYGTAQVLAGKKELNHQVFDKDHPTPINYPGGEDAYYRDAAAHLGISNKSMQEMRGLNEAGFGNYYNIDSKGRAVPTQGHTNQVYYNHNLLSGVKDPNTGKIPGGSWEQYWRDWESGSSWSEGPSDDFLDYSTMGLSETDMINLGTLGYSRPDPEEFSSISGDVLPLGNIGGTNVSNIIQDAWGDRKPDDSPERAMERYQGYNYNEDTAQDVDPVGEDFGMSEAEAEAMGDEGMWMASGGRVGMQNGGEAPPMPQQGEEGDMANLGMINAPAAEPQQGGQQSVEDDIPREADEGDYILPYETVLMVGLKQLNRYAKEAIDLAVKNDVNLGGTDLDPTDDVPIKVSNYEYHIPKVLVPFFGGGKKYLDKIREEGLALRKRLEEEKQPSAQEQQPQVPMEEAPPQMEPQAAPPPQMAQAAPAPQPPMMQRGGFVLSPDEKKQPTTEAMLEADTTQAQESSYNQMQALERTRKQAQQPPMVDPTGKIVQQGFAAPQGYQDGDMVEDPDLMVAVAAKTEPPMPDWANRALDPKTPVMMNEETGEPQTLGLITDKINDMFHVYPTIRMVGKDLKRYDADEALSITMKKKDSIKFKTEEEANSWSDRLVNQVSELRNLQNGQPDMPPTVEEVSPPMPQEGFSPVPEEEIAPMPQEEMQGFAQQPMVA